MTGSTAHNMDQSVLFMVIAIFIFLNNNKAYVCSRQAPDWMERLGSAGEESGARGIWMLNPASHGPMEHSCSGGTVAAACCKRKKTWSKTLQKAMLRLSGEAFKIIRSFRFLRTPGPRMGRRHVQRVGRQRQVGNE